MYSRVIIFDDVFICNYELFLKIINNAKHVEIEYTGHGYSSRTVEFEKLVKILNSKLLSYKKQIESPRKSEYMDLLELYQNNYRIDLDIRINPSNYHELYVDTKHIPEFLQQCESFRLRNRTGFARMVTCCIWWMLCWKFGNNEYVSRLPRDIALLICRVVWLGRYEPVFYTSIP